MFEYKIVTERDSLLSGRFDLEALETALNSYAAEGWRVAQGFVGSSVWKSAKAEVVVILEREVTEPSA